MSVESKALFDYKSLESELGQESVCLLCRLFLEDTKDLTQEVDKAVASEDANMVRTYVHMLKGCCRSIVALSAEDFCDALEDAAAAIDWPSIKVGAKALGPLYTRLSAEVLAYLDRASARQ